MTKTSVSASISVKDAEIAKIVLMPGDPLRAKHVAERYLENPVCFNTVRNMLGYTGTYKGKKISVMGSGMGIPSMGLYATELYTQFDVDAIIRIGSAGGLVDEVHMRDVVIAMAASSNSSYGDAFGLPGHLTPVAELWHACQRRRVCPAAGPCMPRSAPSTPAITSTTPPPRSMTRPGNLGIWLLKWRPPASIGPPPPAIRKR